ncbi:hypothetical protein RJ639_004724 [Escallonia herrerae]|uniref:Protein kinase domain-containing protein n=1 Tax=Escallonia herrerae TaxID=1293975 RepID=A0AA88W9G7_9ASTE|nr:hypothetical protein RJ639_004724 [Escallonia herrerae]
MALLVLSVLLFCVTSSCKANKIPICQPSSCGIIQNITCPFQLEGQNPPNQSCYNPHTGRPSFQLTCQNNLTILTLAPSRNYHVRSINYNNNSIWLVDPGLRKADCSTTPVHSLTVDDLPLDFYYLYASLASFNTPVVFLECNSRPVSTRYVVAGGGGTCGNASGTYVVLGDMLVSEVESSCSVSKVAWVSSSYGHLMENSSYLDIHGGMAYGFELSFWHFYYSSCASQICYISNPSSFRPTSRFIEQREIEPDNATAEKKHTAKKMLILALWCIQTKPSDRLSTSKLVEMLERGGEFLQMPPNPFLYLHEMTARDHGMAIINPSEISLPFEDLIFEGRSLAQLPQLKKESLISPIIIMGIRAMVLLVLSVLIICATTSCKANKIPLCQPSSCGSIRNIACPFQLEGQNPPNQSCYNPHTGRPSFQLTCQNNLTILTLAPSRNYHVRSINYNNNSIWLVDPGLRKADCSTTPVHSLTVDDLPLDFYYLHASLAYFNTPVVFLECKSRPVSARYVVAGGSGTCGNASGTYVVLGDMAVSEVEGSCSVSKVAWVSSNYGHLMENSSYLDIHGGMAYGFELSFWYRHSSCASQICDIFNLSSLRPTSRCVRQIWISFWYNVAVYRYLELLVIGLLLTARFVCGFPLLVTLLICTLRKQHLSMYDTIEDFLQGYNNLMPIRYKYSEIKKITNNFKEKLGEGGFGTVYKGKLRSGILVAVKMMSKPKATGQDFINEVATIGRIHHVNVVKLIGFCSDGKKRALIFNFMPHGSLEKYIFPREEGTISLSYEKIYNISLGVARGIEYLHRGCDLQILHFDIKPHNILLDENFTPKVSDFGLAKLYATDESIVALTAIRGTMGYMAPELFYKNIGGISYKADVYSYGMLLMEMAGRRKNFNKYDDDSSQNYFPSWIFDRLSKGDGIEIQDASEEERKMVKKMIIVALWCIQLKPSDRPAMTKVVEMLEGDVELLQMPSELFLHPREVPTDHYRSKKTLSDVSLLSEDFITEGR